jgi:hypothetical protein
VIGVVGFKSTLAPLLDPVRASQWSSMGGACASTPTGGIVHEPDLRLDLIIVNWLHQAVSSCLDGFICAVGWRLCALLKLITQADA